MVCTIQVIYYFIIKLNVFIYINNIIIVLLLNNGKVITFGSNSNGQLGCSLTLSKKGPTVLKIPRLKHPIINISAGSNHTALVSKDGKLYTFGSYLVNIFIVYN